MENVLKKTLRETFAWRVWNWTVGSLGSLNALLLIGHNYFNFGTKNTLIVGLCIIVGLYVLRFILLFFQNLYRYWYEIYKESVYGDMMLSLGVAFSHVHWLRKMNPIPDEHLVFSMGEICDCIKKYFERKNKSKCAVSIKLAIDTMISANTQLRSLCSDKDSQHQNTIVYNTSTYTHKIFMNSCFNIILTNLTLNKKRNFYLNNNIKSTPDYQSSNTQSYENGELPYESELVVPIIPLKNYDSGITHELIGFIWISCKAKNGFDNKYDIGIMEGVADGIFDVILQHNQNHISM